MWEIVVDHDEGIDLTPYSSLCLVFFCLLHIEEDLKALSAYLWTLNIDCRLDFIHFLHLWRVFVLLLSFGVDSWILIELHIAYHAEDVLLKQRVKVLQWKFDEFVDFFLLFGWKQRLLALQPSWDSLIFGSWCIGLIYGDYYLAFIRST